MNHLTSRHNYPCKWLKLASFPHLMKYKLREEVKSQCVSNPLLMMGGDVGDIEGHALLAGGGSGGGGGGGESCPSLSEELSSVKSITSTFLLLLPSLPPWLDDEELR